LDVVPGIVQCGLRLEQNASLTLKNNNLQSVLRKPLSLLSTFFVYFQSQSCPRDKNIITIPGSVQSIKILLQSDCCLQRRAAREPVPGPSGTVRGRLARTLGMAPPARQGQRLPEVAASRSRATPDCGVNSMRARAGIPALHIFGPRNELAPVSECVHAFEFILFLRFLRAYEGELDRFWNVFDHKSTGLKVTYLHVNY